MEFNSLISWAEFNLKNDNVTLIRMGIKDTKISKVRNMLKEGIIPRCKIILADEEKKKKYVDEIESFIKQLKTYGLNHEQSSPLPVKTNEKP